MECPLRRADVRTSAEFLNDEDFGIGIPSSSSDDISYGSVNWGLPLLILFINATFSKTSAELASLENARFGIILLSSLTLDRSFTIESLRFREGMEAALIASSGL